MPGTALDTLEAIYNEVLGVLPDRGGICRHQPAVPNRARRNCTAFALRPHAGTEGEGNSPSIFGQVNSAAIWEKVS